MSKKPDVATERRMFEAIGSGIQAFSLVEYALGMVFSSLMRPVHGGFSMGVLESARHIETKLRIVRDLGPHRLKAKDLEEFNNLMNRIGHKADFRHKLAHWAVSEYPIPKEPYLKKGQKAKFALLPPVGTGPYLKIMIGNLFPQKGKRPMPIQLQDIIEFDRGARELFRDLATYAGRFPNIPEAGNVPRPPSRPLKVAPKRRTRTLNVQLPPEPF